jgi:hypothetical protein
MASYEKELERWWSNRLAAKNTGTEIFRQRADALKTKMTGPEPTPRGPPPSSAELDFLKDDDPTVAKLKSEIMLLEKQTKELDVGPKLKRSDEYRKELKNKKKIQAPPPDWRAGVRTLVTVCLVLKLLRFIASPLTTSYLTFHHFTTCCT